MSGVDIFLFSIHMLFALYETVHTMIGSSVKVCVRFSSFKSRHFPSIHACSRCRQAGLARK